MLEKPEYINLGGKLLNLKKPKVMGILNITPDSFYKGSRYNSDENIIRAAVSMMEEGADIIDIGGYSSRPGATNITHDEESERVLKAIRIVAKELPDALISIDTFRSEIAREAILESGASMINDITGGDGDSEMLAVVERLNVPYVIMHMKGVPRTMQINPVYEDIVAEILKWFGERIFRLQSAGVRDIIIDPGFGFGKTINHNFEMLRRLGDFSIAGLPLMVGVSRKSMIWKTLNLTAEEALNGTTALNTIALVNGADFLRVHDVKEAVQAVSLFEMIKKS